MGDIEKLADIFKSLSDPTRLKLVRLLSMSSSSEITLNDCEPDTCTGKGGPLCVNALANSLGVTQSAVSQHLRVLRQAGIVKGERKGAFVHYTIDRSSLESFKTELRNTLGELFFIG
ncbi:metalloregulator ArsR/SmtB family transcription factor [Desulfococcaceae bacterium HSG8]|nr:metalloregulator ArsR/SmtB family transcription factor [Desulfococcaceae bacterium HSG8]